MERTRAKGDYASAYKLSRATIDSKAVRRERRSIEQKEFRFEGVNKRRNLQDLSPLQESDPTVNSSHYKGKTPLRSKENTSSEKAPSRLEQLKRWREERDKKKKEDLAKSRNPVFKVTKADHKDTNLFKKEPLKRHPVKPVPVPQSVKVTTKPQVKSVPEVSKLPVKAQKSTTKPSATRCKTSQSVSNCKLAQSATSRPKSQETKSSRNTPGKLAASKASSLRERSQNLQRATTSGKQRSQPSTRATRSTTQSSTEAPAAKVVSEEFESPDMSKVTTSRGAENGDSFAPVDFTFNASTFTAPSFGFQPLSPNSAAKFLNPGQDNSCTFFLESAPKRNSTPIRESRNSQSSPNMEDKSTQETMIHINVTSAMDKSGGVRRSSRLASRSNVPADETVVQSMSAETTAVGNTGTPSAQRRSKRRSVMTAAEIVAEQAPVSGTPRRSRRSVGSILKGDSHSTPAAIKAETPVSTRRSKRRSVISETMPEERDAAASFTTSTPGLRKCSRKSVASAPVVEEIPESMACDEENGESQDMEMKSSEPVLSIPYEGPKPGNDTFDGNDDVFNDSLKENISPRRNVRTPKHIRNKSFGGFRLPSADSVVLSGKRKRKSMLPKSPEEWVQVLKNSPMVEMTRRKSKHGNASLPILDLDEDILADAPLVSPDEAGPSHAVTCPASTSRLDVAEAGPSHAVTSPARTSRLDVSRVEALSIEVEPLQSVSMETEASSSRASTNTSSSTVNSNETVQVGEITSTQGGSDEGEGDEMTAGETTVYNVLYFRSLLCSQSERLNSLCKIWEKINTPDLTEEVQGQIRTTVGKAQLLMNQRFRQFEGLVDACEFNTGEKQTTCIDLKGFWDMVYIQVEDVDAKFAELKKRQERNWAYLTPIILPKKVVKKKVKKDVAAKPGKSKFTAFKAQLKLKSQPVRSPGQKTPKFNPRAGTPKKYTPSTPTGKPASTENTPTSTEKQQVAKETLSLPATNTERFSRVRSPARKNYVPVVPSPLLQDTTPAPRPTRACTQKTPKRPLEDEDKITSECKRAKATPGRGLRPRKSVNFSDEAPASLAVGGTDTEFTRLLQPSVCESPVAEPVNDADFMRLLQPKEATSNTDNVAAIHEEDIFFKYLQPQENEEKLSKSRRSSLKGCRSTERRRSHSRAVHFSASSQDEVPHMKMPRTPYNRESLVKPRRSLRRSSIAQKKEDDDDIFNIDNIDNDENVPPPSFRSPRPSLLGTPPNLNRATKVNRNVPTATLISFTP